MIHDVLLGDFNKDSCDYSPSNLPDVINVGATQQAADIMYPGIVLL